MEDASEKKSKMDKDKQENKSKNIREIIKIIKYFSTYGEDLQDFKENFFNWSECFVSEWKSCNFVEKSAIQRMRPPIYIQFMLSFLFSFSILEYCRSVLFYDSNVSYLTLGFSLYSILVLIQMSSKILVLYLSQPSQYISQVYKDFQQICSVSRIFSHRLKIVQETFNIDARQGEEYYFIAFDFNKTKHNKFSLTSVSLYNNQGIFLAMLVFTIVAYCEFEAFDIFLHLSIGLVIFSAIEKCILGLIVWKKITEKREKIRKNAEKFISWLNEKCEVKLMLQKRNIKTNILSLIPLNNFDISPSFRYVNFITFISLWENIFHLNLLENELEVIVSAVVYGHYYILGNPSLSSLKLDLFANQISKSKTPITNSLQNETEAVGDKANYEETSQNIDYFETSSPGEKDRRITDLSFTENATIETPECPIPNEQNSYFSKPELTLLQNETEAIGDKENSEETAQNMNCFETSSLGENDLKINYLSFTENSTIKTPECPIPNEQNSYFSKPELTLLQNETEAIGDNQYSEVQNIDCFETSSLGEKDLKITDFSLTENSTIETPECPVPNEFNSYFSKPVSMTQDPNTDMKSENVEYILELKGFDVPNGSTAHELSSSLVINNAKIIDLSFNTEETITFFTGLDHNCFDSRNGKNREIYYKRDTELSTRNNHESAESNLDFSLNSGDKKFAVELLDSRKTDEVSFTEISGNDRKREAEFQILATNQTCDYKLDEVYNFAVDFSNAFQESGSQSLEPKNVNIDVSSILGHNRYYSEEEVKIFRLKLEVEKYFSSVQSSDNNEPREVCNKAVDFTSVIEKSETQNVVPRSLNTEEDISDVSSTSEQMRNKSEASLNFIAESEAWISSINANALEYEVHDANSKNENSLDFNEHSCLHNGNTLLDSDNLHFEVKSADENFNLPQHIEKVEKVGHSGYVLLLSNANDLNFSTVLPSYEKDIVSTNCDITQETSEEENVPFSPRIELCLHNTPVSLRTDEIENGNSCSLMVNTVNGRKDPTTENNIQNTTELKLETSNDNTMEKEINEKASVPFSPKTELCVNASVSFQTDDIKNGNSCNLKVDTVNGRKDPTTENNIRNTTEQKLPTSKDNTMEKEKEINEEASVSLSPKTELCLNTSVSFQTDDIMNGNSCSLMVDTVNGRNYSTTENNIQNATEQKISTPKGNTMEKEKEIYEEARVPTSPKTEMCLNTSVLSQTDDTENGRSSIVLDTDSPKKGPEIEAHFQNETEQKLSSANYGTIKKGRGKMFSTQSTSNEVYDSEINENICEEIAALLTETEYSDLSQVFRFYGKESLSTNCDIPQKTKKEEKVPFSNRSGLCLNAPFLTDENGLSCVALDTDSPKKYPELEVNFQSETEQKLSSADDSSIKEGKGKMFPTQSTSNEIYDSQINENICEEIAGLTTETKYSDLPQKDSSHRNFNHHGILSKQTNKAAFDENSKSTLEVLPNHTKFEMKGRCFVQRGRKYRKSLRRQTKNKEDLDESLNCPQNAIVHNNIKIQNGSSCSLLVDTSIPQTDSTTKDNNQNDNEPNFSIFNDIKVGKGRKIIFPIQSTTNEISHSQMNVNICEEKSSNNGLVKVTNNSKFSKKDSSQMTFNHDRTVNEQKSNAVLYEENAKSTLNGIPTASKSEIKGRHIIRRGKRHRKPNERRHAQDQKDFETKLNVIVERYVKEIDRITDSYNSGEQEIYLNKFKECKIPAGSSIPILSTIDLAETGLKYFYYQQIHSHNTRNNFISEIEHNGANERTNELEKPLLSTYQKEDCEIFSVNETFLNRISKNEEIDSTAEFIEDGNHLIPFDINERNQKTQAEILMNKNILGNESKNEMDIDKSRPPYSTFQDSIQKSELNESVLSSRTSTNELNANNTSTDVNQSSQETFQTVPIQNENQNKPFNVSDIFETSDSKVKIGKSPMEKYESSETVSLADTKRLNEKSPPLFSNNILKHIVIDENLEQTNGSYDFNSRAFISPDGGESLISEALSLRTGICVRDNSPSLTTLEVHSSSHDNKSLANDRQGHTPFSLRTTENSTTGYPSTSSTINKFNFKRQDSKIYYRTHLNKRRFKQDKCAHFSSCEDSEKEETQAKTFISPKKRQKRRYFCLWKYRITSPSDVYMSEETIFETFSKTVHDSSASNEMDLDNISGYDKTGVGSTEVAFYQCIEESGQENGGNLKNEALTKQPRYLSNMPRKWPSDSERPPTGSSEDDNFHFHPSTSASDSTIPEKLGTSLDSSQDTSVGSSLSENMLSNFKNISIDDATVTSPKMSAENIIRNSRNRDSAWRSDLYFERSEDDSSEYSTVLERKNFPKDNSGCSVQNESMRDPLEYHLKYENLDVNIVDSHCEHLTIRFVYENEDSSDRSPNNLKAWQTLDSLSSMDEVLIPTETRSQLHGRFSSAHLDDVHVINSEGYSCLKSDYRSVFDETAKTKSQAASSALQSASKDEKDELEKSLNRESSSAIDNDQCLQNQSRCKIIKNQVSDSADKREQEIKSKDFIFESKGVKIKYEPINKSDFVTISYGRHKDSTKMTFKSKEKKMYLKMSK